MGTHNLFSNCGARERNTPKWVGLFWQFFPVKAQWQGPPLWRSRKNYENPKNLMFKNNHSGVVNSGVGCGDVHINGNDFGLLWLGIFLAPRGLGIALWFSISASYDLAMLGCSLSMCFLIAVVPLALLYVITPFLALVRWDNTSRLTASGRQRMHRRTCGVSTCTGSLSFTAKNAQLLALRLHSFHLAACSCSNWSATSSLTSTCGTIWLAAESFGWLLVGESCTENPIRRGWTGVAVTAQQTKLISISFLCSQAASTPHNFCCSATCYTSVTKYTRQSRTKLLRSLISAAGGRQKEMLTSACKSKMLKPSNTKNTIHEFHQQHAVIKLQRTSKIEARSNCGTHTGFANCKGKEKVLEMGVFWAGCWTKLLLLCPVCCTKAVLFCPDCMSRSSFCRSCSFSFIKSSSFFHKCALSASGTSSCKRFLSSSNSPCTLCISSCTSRMVVILPA